MHLTSLWFFYASLISLYTGSFESTVENHLNTIKSLKTLDEYKEFILSRVNERLTNDYFDITLVGSEGLAVSGRGNNAWNAYVASLNIMNAKILFSKSNLLVSKLFEPGTDGNRKSLEKHHLFPKAYLKSQGYSDAKINQMANYAFIDWNGHQWEISKDGNIVYSDKLNDRNGIAPELLFLEKCLNWVKNDGIIGIVMAKGQLDNREAFAIRKTVCNRAKILAVVNLHEDTFEPFCGSKASVIFLQKKSVVPSDYRIFMAISNKVGQTSRGEAIFKKDSEGNPIIKNGQHVLDEDLSQIAEAYQQFKEGSLQESEFRYTIAFSDLDKETLSFNPVHYLPQHNAAFKKVITLGDREDFELHRLGDIAKVFNGPRFKRPYADIGVTSGKNIRRYFTGTALTQLNSDNVKYLDSSKANAQVKKHLDALTIHKGYILVSDSGTLGRVTYALEQHDGHVATNNLIRIIVDDIPLRGYLYEFLQSELGQSLMLKNAYGTNQEHLEPDIIADIPIPIPKDKTVIQKIGNAVTESIEQLEKSISAGNIAKTTLNEILE